VTIVLQLSNETPFAVERSVQLDGTGMQHWVVIVKATYQFDRSGAVKRADAQEPVCVASRYAGEPGQSSLLRETEMTYDHPGTDVIVNATAHAPAGRKVTEMEARVRVGPLGKSLRVVGERVWTQAAMDLVPSAPLAFTSMPICWERAYGGKAPGSTAFELRNPVGRGFGESRQQLVQQRLPNIEDPAAPIRRWRDRPAPAGFGALAGHWSPRRERAGTYDEAWRRQKLPLLPDDFDPLFFSAAAPGLHAREPLRGHEKVELEGLAKEGPIAFNLPREVLLVDTWLGSARLAQPVRLARVIIDADDQKLVMVWRSSLPFGPRFREIRRTRVDYKVRLQS
jgi:hypothetical protein